MYEYTENHTIAMSSLHGLVIAWQHGGHTTKVYDNHNTFNSITVLLVTIVTNCYYGNNTKQACITDIQILIEFKMFYWLLRSTINGMDIMVVVVEIPIHSVSQKETFYLMACSKNFTQHM